MSLRFTGLYSNSSISPGTPLCSCSRRTLVATLGRAARSRQYPGDHHIICADRHHAETCVAGIIVVMPPVDPFSQPRISPSLLWWHDEFCLAEFTPAILASLLYLWYQQ